MKKLEPHIRSGFESSPKDFEQLLKLERLLDELKKKELPENIQDKINQEIDKLNSFTCFGKEESKMVGKTYENILKLLREELNLVPKQYYTSLWLALGMSAFGIPIGVVFGLSIDNLAFLGIGIPFGMAIGIALGKSMDDKAMKEGRVLNLEN